MEAEYFVAQLTRALLRGEGWESPGLKVVPVGVEPGLVGTVDAQLAVDVRGAWADHRVARVTRWQGGRYSVHWIFHGELAVLVGGTAEAAARVVMAMACAWSKALQLHGGA